MTDRAHGAGPRSPLAPEEPLRLQLQLLDRLEDAVFVTDPAGRVAYWGRGAEALYGIPAAQACGRPLRDLLRVAWASPAEERAGQAALERRGAWQGESVHAVASGRQLRVESTFSVLRDADGADAGLLAIVREAREPRRVADRLPGSREQLRALALRIQTIREEEKARLARDLHDELGEVLTALRMELRRLEAGIEALEPEVDAGALLDRIVEGSALVNRALAAVKRIALDLRPGALDRLGLDAALRQEAKRFHERTGIACDADVPGLDVELPVEVATALYRICQEALTNVVRHAGARHVSLSLEVGGDRATLRVADDGRGMDRARAASPHALGILGMTERARALGGGVSFHGRAGRGTVVTASIPLRGASATPPGRAPGAPQGAGRAGTDHPP